MDIRNEKTRLSLYKTMVRSQLSYCTQVCIVIVIVVVIVLLKTDLVTKSLNYISNLQNLYLVLRSIKLLLYYIIKNIKNSKTNKVNRPKFILSHLLFFWR